MLDNRLIIIIASVISFIAGMFVYDRFFVPEFTTEYKETIVTDTTYKYYKEKYREDSLKFTSLSDSIEIMNRKYAEIIKRDSLVIVHDSIFVDKLFEAPLRRYTGLKPHLYGDTGYNVVVAGSMLDIEISNNFKIPTVTNTVTKETRTVIKPSGLYGNFGFQAGDQQLSYLVGATYLNNKSMIFYNYNIPLKSHQAGIGIKVFGR